MGKLIFSMFLVLGTVGSVRAYDGEVHGFSSENNLIQPGFVARGISYDTYHRILNRIEEIYRPLYQAKGKRLKIVRNWESLEMQAYADNVSSKTVELKLTFPGGIPRHPATTADSFATIACHEVGHHMGGAPLDASSLGSYTIEGQADYFATLKCLRYFFEDTDNMGTLAQRKIPPKIIDSCRASFSTDDEIAICVRSSLASLDTVKFLSNIVEEDGPPDMSTPSKRVVEITDTGYPLLQCRLDTLLAGAVCPVNKSLPVNDTDPTAGACSRRNGDLVGVRPLCWYKPEDSLATAGH